MRLFNSQPGYSVCFWTISRPRRADWRATIMVKAAYRLVRGGVSVPDNTQPPAPRGDDPVAQDSALLYASDFVPYKPKTDFLVIGNAHLPDGEPAGFCRVSITLGEEKKSLAVFGDRDWTWGPFGPHPGEPAPFMTMPISYERAFGGPGSLANPVGRGSDVGAGRPLPNIERFDDMISQSTHRPAPAGFGPQPVTWQLRARKSGSFGDTWQKEHWPWYPPDIDWSFFNAAPTDQQFPYCQGDEKLAFENMRAHQTIYQTRLPGGQARVFVERCENADFEEVPVNLDTIWVDVEEEKLVLLWRGTTRVESPRMRDIASVYATLETLDAPSDIKAHHAAFLHLRDGPTQAAAAKASTQRAAVTARRDVAEARIAEARNQVQAAQTTAESVLASTGLDSKRQRLAETRDPMARLERALVALKGHDPARGQKLEEQLEDIDRRIGEVLGRVQRPDSWTTERVIRTIAEGGSLQKVLLDGLNLDGLDFSGADLRGAMLKNATLRHAHLFRANLAGADLEKADLTGACCVEADLTRANVANAVAVGASFAGAAVGYTIFSKLSGNDADFSGAHGASADFTEAILNKARFFKGTLPRALFSAARLAFADFTEASLTSADFVGAHAQGAIFEGANLTNLRASRFADFLDGRFTGATAPRSVWQQAKLDRADFSRATLSHAQFPEATLKNAVFDCARLDGASFEDAVMTGARLTRAHLLRASFERADLTDAIIEGSNLYGAGLLDTKLEHTSFQGSFIAQTMLANQ